MKTACSLFALLAGASLLAGCGDSSKPSAAPAAAAQPAPSSAMNYAQTLVNSKKVADKTIDVTALNAALQLFNVQEGRYPKTLAELVPNYIGKLPEAPLGYKITYDAAKGEVKAVKQ